MALFDIQPLEEKKSLGIMTDSEFQNFRQKSASFSDVQGSNQPETKPLGVVPEGQFPQFIQQQTQVQPKIPQLNTANVLTALSGHESRGAMNPQATQNPITKATGITQITPIMFQEWQNKFAKDKKLARSVSFRSLNNNPELQTTISNDSIEGILNKYSTGLDDWKTSTKKLQSYKEEIRRDFNEPIYWIAGEWIAGPNWVAKLDNPTAPGAKETVRDYVRSIGDRFSYI